MKQDGSIGSLNQNSNYLAYFLMFDIYGYSGIKPRAIQDYYDVLGSPANPTFWRMLNVKYIIFDKEVNSPDLQLVYAGNKSFVYLNRNALPRAYFVNQVAKKSGLEIINMVKNTQFDPSIPRSLLLQMKKLQGLKYRIALLMLGLKNLKMKM